MTTREQCKNKEQNIVLNFQSIEPKIETKPKSNEIYCTYCKNNTIDIFYNHILKNYLCWSCQNDWQKCEMAAEKHERIEQLVAYMKYDRLHPDNY